MDTIPLVPEVPVETVAVPVIPPPTEVDADMDAFQSRAESSFPLTVAVAVAVVPPEVVDTDPLTAQSFRRSSFAWLMAFAIGTARELRSLAKSCSPKTSTFPNSMFTLWPFKFHCIGSLTILHSVLNCKGFF